MYEMWKVRLKMVEKLNVIELMKQLRNTIKYLKVMEENYTQLCVFLIKNKILSAQDINKIIKRKAGDKDGRELAKKILGY